MLDTQQTAGRMLKEAREARMISINEVAQRLLLSKSTISAIEDDDYSKIAAQVYAEGYIKAYANFLQIPVDNILANFRMLNIYSAPEVVNINNEVKKEAPERLLKFRKAIKLDKRIIWIVIGLLIIFFSYMSCISIIKNYVNNSKSPEVINVPSSNQNNQDVIHVDVNLPSPNTPSMSEQIVLDTSDSSSANKKKDKAYKVKKEANSEPNLIITKPQ